MWQLLILSLCVTCCLSTNWHEERRLENLKRDLQLELLERQLEREESQRGLGEVDYNEELELVQPFGESERFRQKKQVIKDCIQGDLIFVVDSSGSIGIENWPHVLDFINDVVDKTGVSAQGTHIGLVTYGNKAHIQFNLNNYTDPALMKAAVSKSKFLDENTNTSGGIYTALKIMFTKANGDREKAPNIMVIITDGVSTYDNISTIPYAVEAKNANILVVSIGVGNKTSQAELEGMASAGNDGKPIVFKVGSYETLDLVNQKLALVACDKDEEPVVDCPVTSCKNKCQFGFVPTPDGCVTCQCLPTQKICP